MGESFLNRMKRVVLQCKRNRNVPFPCGHIQHLYIFIAIALELLPLGLVESSGWFSIIWAIFSTYGLLDLEHCAIDLSYPFGYFFFDVAFDRLAQRFNYFINENRKNSEMWAPTFVYLDRPSSCKSMRQFGNGALMETTLLMSPPTTQCYRYNPLCLSFPMLIHTSSSFHTWNTHTRTRKHVG